MVSIIKKIIYKLCEKKIDVTKMVTKTISTSSENVFVFPLSANIIRTISKDNEIFFFRECAQRVSLRNYLDKCIEEFYEISKKGISIENFKQDIPIETKFSDEYVEKFRSYIDLQKKFEKDFYKSLYNMPKYLQKEGFNIWFGKKSISDTSMKKIGLEKKSNYFDSILPFFLSYISSSISTFKQNEFVKEGDYECFNATRSLATYEIAKILHIENLVAKSELVKLQVDKRLYYGVMCNKAPGVRALDLKVPITPMFQRDITSLNLLDSLCYQKDHFLNNYNVITNNDGLAVSVCAFDNDNVWTFFVSPTLSFKPQLSDSPFVKDGRVNRPHLSKEIVDVVLNLSDKDLIPIQPYLNNLQLWAFKKRLNKLKSAIQNSMLANPKFVLEDNEWNIDTLKEELCGKYGKTYTCIYDSYESIENIDTSSLLK